MASRSNAEVIRHRRIILARLLGCGFTYAKLRGIVRASGLQPHEVIDVFIKVQRAWEARFGVPRYTGNNRRYSNGVVGYEARCPECGLTFWQTGLPYAVCKGCSPEPLVSRD